ncbi:MAG: universal stress protein [Bacteroidia bacterium]|nr:universal stress protein [Bacteroidia bacterium]
MMKAVLFPTDFSAHAEVALPFAIRLAQQLHAQLVVMHVEPKIGISVLRPIRHWERGSETQFDPQEWDQHQREITTKIEEIAPDVPVGFLTSTGAPVATISDFVSSNKPDWIVMGTRGLESDKSDGPFGSIALGVVRHVKVPVLLVPQHAEGRTINHIAYASDFQEKDLSSVLALAPLVRSLEGTLTCVHVRGQENFWNSVQREFFDKLYDLSQNSSTINFRILRNEQVKDALEAFIEQENIDAVALLHRHHHSMKEYYQESVTRRVALGSKIPVIVFHED